MSHFCNSCNLFKRHQKFGRLEKSRRLAKLIEHAVYEKQLRLIDTKAAKVLIYLTIVKKAVTYLSKI